MVRTELQSGVDIENYWNPDHPVLEILRRRRDSGSKPGDRSDGAKVALTVAGGGMRGAISAAMCVQLDEAGFRDAFDVVYGCSSGALNAAYFLAQPTGTCWYPLSIYYEDLASDRFIRYSRPLHGGSVVDLGYVFDEVLGSVKPLDYDAAVNSPVELVVLTTDLSARATFPARGFTSGDELKEYLRASARPPLAVNGQSHIAGRSLIDGALLAPAQYRIALDDGCTHVLSLGTRRMAPSAARNSLAHHAYAQYLGRVRAGLGTAYLEARRTRRNDRQELSRLRFATEGPGPHVLGIAPLPWMAGIRFHDTDPLRVSQAIREAYSVSHCATEGIGADRLRDGWVRAMTRVTIAGPGAPGPAPDPLPVSAAAS